MDIKNFGKRLTEAREDLRMSQKTLSQLTGIPTSTISKIEAGGQKKSGDAALLAHHLQINTLWLTHGIGLKHPLSDRLRALEQEDDVLVYQYLDPRCIYGPNFQSKSHEELRQLPFSKSVFDESEIDQDNCFSFVSTDVSMGEIGDKFLIHTNENDPQLASGKIYAIAGKGVCIIRRIFVSPTNDYNLVCDNQDKSVYEDVSIKGSELNSITILGRVRYSGGKR